MAVMRRKQRAIERREIAVIDQDDDAAVFFCADDPAHGLQHFVHAGKRIGEVISGLALRVEVLFHKVGFRVDHRQPDADDDRADEPLAAEIDAFGKHAAQHAEMQLHLTEGLEPLQEC